MLLALIVIITLATPLSISGSAAAQANTDYAVGNNIDVSTHAQSMSYATTLTATAIPQAAAQPHYIIDRTHGMPVHLYWLRTHRRR